MDADDEPEGGYGIDNEDPDNMFARQYINPGYTKTLKP